MKKILKLDVEDIEKIIAEKFGVPELDVKVEFDALSMNAYIVVHWNEEDIEEKPQAYWEYWGGWRGNHDKRIDDAKCSSCGFEHPTVRGGNAPNQLYKICPMCGKRMGHRGGFKKYDNLLACSYDGRSHHIVQ